MSIRSFTGNVGASVRNSVETALNSVKARVSSVTSTVTTAASNVFSGGFVGINDTNIEELKTAIDNYCNTIEDAIAGFNAAAQTDAAYKGAIAEAVSGYILAIKEMLQAYVSQMRIELTNLDGYVAEYKQHVSSMVTDISADAQALRSEAASIKID